MLTLDFGENKGKQLADCDEKYLKWLVSHEKVLAKRHRWAAGDAKFILEHRAQVVAPAPVKENTTWQEWHESLKKAETDRKIAKHLTSTPVKVDLGLKGNSNKARVFLILG